MIQVTIAVVLYWFLTTACCGRKSASAGRPMTTNQRSQSKLVYYVHARSLDAPERYERAWDANARLKELGGKQGGAKVETVREVP